MDKILFVFSEKNLKTSFPIILLVIGLGLFIYGIFGTFEDLKWQHFCDGLGKAILIGGIFSLLLKSMQFMGIFKEELTKIIFETKFLSNRKDIFDYWEKVSQEMFRNKFPNISQKLLKDVQNIYFPTTHTMYYDNCEHIIEIDLEKEGSNNILVKKTTNLTAIPINNKETYTYDFSNIMPFKNELTNETDIYYESTSVKINGIVTKPTHKKSVKGKEVINEFCVTLSNSDKYEIERIENKKYDVTFDNIIYFGARRIFHKMTVEIHYPKDKLRIELKKCGTLQDFLKQSETTHSTKYSYKGLIYMEQGYYINVIKI
ncbi:MAG: hypothetical protein RJA07_2654 [Bacteroidota bacterium]|jgi:hypothetical protein